MTERPILFSAPMVRAILDGKKTQTRRLVKPKRMPESHWMVETHGLRHELTHWDNDTAETSPIACPYGQPGDKLWVRETWMPDAPRDGTWPHVAFDGCKPHDMTLIPDRYRAPRHCLYRADGHGNLTGWTPAIHMFRWASRITLEITRVRVERLQDISDENLQCEGLQEVIDSGVDHDGTARDAWRALWAAINGQESWEDDPWVWVVEFTRTK